MFQIEWRQLTTALFTATHGRWTFKKLVSQSQTIYSIWRDGEMKFSTRAEQEFNNKANTAIANTAEWWW